MTKRPREEDREERIRNEIVVDAYGPEEQAMGWYTHLEGTLEFPFRVRCRVERAISPLQVDDEVEVVVWVQKTNARMRCSSSLHDSRDR